MRRVEINDRVGWFSQLFMLLYMKAFLFYLIEMIPYDLKNSTKLFLNYTIFENDKSVPQYILDIIQFNNRSIFRRFFPDRISFYRKRNKFFLNGFRFVYFSIYRTCRSIRDLENNNLPVFGGRNGGRYFQSTSHHGYII